MNPPVNPEKRRKPRVAEDKLSEREEKVLRITIDRMLGALGVENIEEYHQQQELVRQATAWFTSMREREASRKDFWKKVGKDVAMDFLKWGIRAILLFFVGVGSYVVGHWGEFFLQSTGSVVPATIAPGPAPKEPPTATGKP